VNVPFYFTKANRKGKVKMELIKIRFGNESDLFESAADRSLTELFRTGRPMFKCSDCLWVPPMDMIETPTEIVILAEIAGVEKEDLEVEISRRAVKVTGRRTEESSGPHATYRLAEIHYGSFERILYLPQAVDSERVSASYARGMLRIRLAKRPADQSHQIPIDDD
jgi:HSP20 family protein